MKESANPFKTIPDPIKSSNTKRNTKRQRKQPVHENFERNKNEEWMDQYFLEDEWGTKANHDWETYLQNEKIHAFEEMFERLNTQIINNILQNIREELWMKKE
jgi:hypothetical protein